MLIERTHTANNAAYPQENADRLEQAQKQTFTAEAISLGADKRKKQELHKEHEPGSSEGHAPDGSVDLPAAPRSGGSAGLLVDIVA